MPGTYGNKNGKRFKKGNSGGPGRPKGYRAPTTIIRDWLTEHPEDAEKMVSVAIDQSNKGNFQYFKYLCDRLEGTPTETRDVNMKGTVHLKIIERMKNTPNVEK